MRNAHQAHWVRIFNSPNSIGGARSNRRLGSFLQNRRCPQIGFLARQSSPVIGFVFSSSLALPTVSYRIGAWLRFFNRRRPPNWLRCAKQPFSQSWFRKKRLLFARLCGSVLLDHPSGKRPFTNGKRRQIMRFWANNGTA
jgi:hypothetical protein